MEKHIMQANQVTCPEAKSRNDLMRSNTLIRPVGTSVSEFLLNRYPFVCTAYWLNYSKTAWADRWCAVGAHAYFSPQTALKFGFRASTPRNCEAEIDKKRL